MNVSTAHSRDPRLDFFRGLALICIFVDHTPGDRLTEVTIRNLGFSDASELFVFISAYSAGLVYSRRAALHGLLTASFRVWRRVGQIYAAHILLVAIATLMALWLVKTVGDPQFVQGMNVAPLIENTGQTLLMTMALLFQPTFMNILPLYIVLLACFPLTLWLLLRNQWLALGLSFGLWLAAREWPGSPIQNPYGQMWQFNPVAWQLLFVLGAGLGVSAPGRGFRVPRSRLLLTAAAAYAVAAFAIGERAWMYDGSTVPLPTSLRLVLFPVMDRVNLSLWRVSHLLALVYIVWFFVPASSALFRWRASRPVVLLGQHSLSMFCVGVLLSLSGWAAFVALGTSPLVQAVVNGLGVAAMIGVAWLLSDRRAPRTGSDSAHRITGAAPVASRVSTNEEAGTA